MSKFMNKTVIAAKTEVTPGTDIVPAAADCILVRNCTITPLEMTYAERQLVRPFFGNSDAIPTTRKVKIAFEVEYAGSGTAGTAPAWGKLLKACGSSETLVAVTSATYAPLSPGVDTLSIYYNIDGVLHKSLFSRGSCTLRKKSNDLSVLAFEFTGLDGGVIDAAALVPSSYGAFKTPVAANKANTTATIFGVATLAVESFELNLAQQVELVTRIGSEQVLHTDRKSAGSVMFEMTSVAVKDWLAQVRAGTLGAISFVHGTGGGNVLTCTVGQAELMSPAFSNVQGIQMAQFQFKAMPTTGGNDEWSIANT